jgi:hypothetical protein
MNRALFVLAVSSLVTASLPARAHFKLQAPADALKTDSTGDPLGDTGTQKSNPCGAGDASGAVTQVRAGSKLHIKLTETVGHGGHYRIALVPKLNPTEVDLPEPDVTLKAGSCDTAKIASPVTAPLLADGVFSHTPEEAESGKLWETDVTVPAQTGPATLQIIEFMTEHDPGCFYHHCAVLEVLASDAPIPAEGGIAGDADDQPPASSKPQDEGCNVSDGNAPGFGTIGLMALIGMTILRRRRRV